MAIKDIGRLLGADEGLNHQIVDTFATLSQTDMAWTEKIWASIARTDGSLQIDFGLGKYQNRGIIDGFGGVSRGNEQWTVRGSRELASAPGADRRRPGADGDRRAAEEDAVPARTQRRAADLVRHRVVRRDAAVLRGAQPGPQPSHRPDRRRRHPLPPGWLGVGDGDRRRRDARGATRGVVRLPRPLVGSASGDRRAVDGSHSLARRFRRASAAA